MFAPKFGGDAVAYTILLLYYCVLNLSLEHLFCSLQLPRTIVKEELQECRQSLVDSQQKLVEESQKRGQEMHGWHRSRSNMASTSLVW